MSDRKLYFVRNSEFNRGGNVFKDTRIGIKNYDIFLNLIEKNPHLLSFIKRQTNEICIDCIKRNWRSIVFVKRQSLRICNVAYSIDKESCVHFDYSNFTICYNYYSLLIDVIGNNGELIRNIKEEYKDYELCLEALLNSKLSWYFTPEEFKKELQYIYDLMYK